MIIRTKTYIQVPLLLTSGCAIVSDTFILFLWKVTTDQPTNGQTLSRKRVTYWKLNIQSSLL